MAIPAAPVKFFSSQGNGKVYLQWQPAVSATSYVIERSLDGITFTALGTSTLPEYYDLTALLGVGYWYHVASVNIDGTSGFTSPQAIVPTPNGEMSLGELRTAGQNRADRLNSGLVTPAEWNTNINQSLTELYDLLITSFEDYYLAAPARITFPGGQALFGLPDGSATFLDSNNAPFVPKAFYKLRGVDLSISTGNNAFVTVHKFNFENRSQYIYPNSASTIYGVFNLRYRVLGNQIEFIPTPSGGQAAQLWYIPRLDKLLADYDITTTGISGWLEYVIVDSAIKALQKDESDITVLAAQKMDIRQRIIDTAANRDAGQPDTITDVRHGGLWGSETGGVGGPGPMGGW